MPGFDPKKEKRKKIYKGQTLKLLKEGNLGNAPYNRIENTKI